MTMSRIPHLANLIRRDLRKRWSLAELPEALGIGPSRLRDLFKQEMGCTVAEYRRTLQLEEARRQLANFVQVKQVMNNVGATDRGRFARQFKQRFGLTPVEYREQYLNRVHVDEKIARAITVATAAGQFALRADDLIVLHNQGDALKIVA